MAKRNANTELNHDNWNEEEEPEEAGVFVKADNETIKGRVIKKAKRRGLNTDGPSTFAGFAGFGKTAAPAAETETEAASGSSAGGAFDFLKKPGTNGSSGESAASFNFASPSSQTSSLFAFGSGGNAKKETTSATFSFGNGSSTDSAKTSGAGGLFAFGSSANASKTESTFSFGKTPENKETTSDKSNDSDKSEVPATSAKPLSDLFKTKESSTAAKPEVAAAPAAAAALPISNPIVMPKSNKWSCPECMIQNDADKEECACCAEPKPGCKPKKAEEKKPALAGTVTSSGFKFGSSTSSTGSAPAPSSGSGFVFGAKTTSESSTNATGFSFGAKTATPSTGSSSSVQTSSSESKKPEEYSKEFLAHLKALNVQVSAWIQTHIEKNPYVFLSPVFKDYEKHLKDIEEKFKNTSTPKSGTTTESATKEKDVPAASKPLLGAVFGSGSNDSTPKASAEPVKFGTGTGFAYGSASSDSGSGEKSVEKSVEKSGFLFGSSSSEASKTGFSFGKSGKTDTESKPAEKSNDKSEEKSSPGFSFGTNKSDAEEKKPPSGFFGSSDTNKTSPEKSGFSGTFGKAIEKNTSTGFVFGSKSQESTNSSTTSGFSFGNAGVSAESKPSTGTGFSFGSSNGDAAGKSGFTFGTAPSTGFGFAASGVAASQEKKDEAAGDEEDQPPKVEVTQVVEEDAFHTVRVKLFYKKEKEFVDKGLGMLHLKKVEGDTKTQMVVRAETNLGNILLNILVSDKMNVIKRKNNLQFMCVPNPPIKGIEGPVIMLAKVKDSLMADQLEAKLEEAIKAT